MKNGNYKKIIFIAAGVLTVGVIVLLIFLNLPLSKAQAKKYIDSDWSESIAEQENQPRYLDMLSQKSSYEINSVDRENKYYTITVTVSAPNLKDYFINKSADMPESANDLDAFLCECIEKTEYTETVAEVYIYELDGETKVSYSDAFVDAMHGGIISYSQEMLRDLYSDYFDGGVE